MSESQFEPTLENGLSNVFEATHLKKIETPQGAKNKNTMKADSGFALETEEKYSLVEV